MQGRIGPTRLGIAVVLIATRAAAADGRDCLPEIGPPAGQQITVTLSTRETLGVLLSACDGDTAIVEHPVLGTLRLEPGTVDRAILVAGDADAPVVDTNADVSETAESATVSETSASPAPAWEREISLGFDGALGNSERSSVRGEIKGERESDRSRVMLRANYRRAEDDSETSESNATAEGRYDWLFLESRWELFAASRFDYDEFKDYDWRWAAQLGPAYRFIDTDTVRLIGRVGAGASQEVGGGDEAVTPELLLGADYVHEFSERQKLTSALEVLPSLGNPGEFRAIGRAEWEAVLADRFDLSLKLGLEDRYDSDTEPDVDSNDLEYYGAIVKKF